MNAKAVHWILAAACLAAWNPSASAATAYEGVVTGTNVYVRSGPSQESYPCAKLDTPARVTVVGQLDTWLKIMPPEGCFSVVAKNDLKLDPTGKTGTVVGNAAVWSYAAGVLRTTNCHSLQKSLAPGTTVKIIGTTDTYYKITPPTGAYFWISAQFVQRAAAGAEGTGGTTPVRTSPTTRPTVSVGVVPERTGTVTPPTTSGTETATGTEPTTQPTTTVTELAVPVGMEEFAVAEKLLLAEYKKPMADRNYDALLQAYETVNVTGDNEHLKKFVDYRVGQIKRDIQIRKDLDCRQQDRRRRQQAGAGPPHRPGENPVRIADDQTRDLLHRPGNPAGQRPVPGHGRLAAAVHHPRSRDLLHQRVRAVHQRRGESPELRRQVRRDHGHDDVRQGPRARHRQCELG